MSKLFFKGSRDSVQLRVTAKCPTDDSREIPIHFKARYRCPDQDERREIAEGARDKTLTDDDIVDRLLIGWEDVKDKNDEPIEFTPENVSAAMQFPPYREALVEGAVQLVFGKEILRAKNSQRPGVTG